jgi:hypothetical protein
VNGARPVTFSVASGSLFALGTTTVTATATDASGNVAHGEFVVEVVDTTPPALTLPAPLVVEATGPDGAAATFTATAHDIVSGSLAVTLTPPSGSLFPVGTTSVVASAMDAAGNVGQGTFTVTVVDTTAPVLTLPGRVTAEATSPAGATATFSGSAVDIVGGSVPVSFTPPSGATFALGTTTVTATAVDAAGNVGTGTFVVEVVDTTKPVITVPPDVTITTCQRPDIGRATATDAAGTPTITSDAPLLFGLGTTVVTWRAADASGNVATGTQKVTAALGDDASCCPVGTKVILGTSANNVLKGTSGPDCILGRGGNDVIAALGGNDFISGGAGDDVIDGSLGDDRIWGGSGRDTIAAGPGSDVVDGGPDHDICAVPPDGGDVVTGCP